MLNVEVSNQTPVQYGDKVYLIVHNNCQHFREKCPICDDTKKVVIRGKEFRCPQCDTHPNDDANRLTLFSWEVVEVIVNHMVIHGPEEKAAFVRYNKGEPNRGDLPFVSKIMGFRRRGNSYDGVYTYDIPVSKMRYDPDEETVRRVVEQISRYDEDLTKYVWTSRKAAEKVMQKQVEHDRKKLEEFDRMHGTEHKYPW